MVYRYNKTAGYMFNLFVSLLHNSKSVMSAVLKHYQWSKNTVFWNAFTVISIKNAIWDFVPCSIINLRTPEDRDDTKNGVFWDVTPCGCYTFSETLVPISATQYKVPAWHYKS
jgi:hypothetical protein